MQSSPFKKLLLVLLLLAVGAALLLQFINSELKPLEKAPPKISKSGFKYRYTPPSLSVSPNKAEAEPESDVASQAKLPREQVEVWLAKHNRNAASLLAALRALDDTNYLNEAAMNFPDNPQVEWTVLARDAFPEERRKWLDLFKASSPSNSLGNYLSAEDFFKNGKSQNAVNELLAATGKPEFDSHETESRLDEEELYLSSGKSPLEASRASMTGVATDMIPELATLKRLCIAMADLQKEKLSAGDTDSAVNLAQMGMALGAQLDSGDSGKYYINQLVGMAAEAVVLRQLDQNNRYDFLGGQTPAQVLQQLKDQKKTFRELAGKFSAAYPSMAEEEIASYLQRQKIYGEAEAMRWVIQQHPPADSTK